MSLQVSNQTTGRRTPQVYQGFGGNVPVAGAAGGGGGGGTTSANGGGAGGNGPRSAKGAGNKQSQIPVAVVGASTEAALSPSVPPKAAVNAGSVCNTPVGVSVGTMPFSFSAQKQQQKELDHQYGPLKQQPEAATGGPVGKDAGQSAVGRKAAANGSSTNDGGAQQSQPAGGNVVVVGGFAPEKNGSSGKKGDVEVVVAAAVSNKSSAGGNTALTSSDGAKIRDSPRSSGRTQQQKPADTIGQKTPEKLASGKPSPKGASDSLINERPLMGFDGDGEEMETLIMEPWEYEDSPMPPQAKSKLLKLGTTVHANAAQANAGTNAGKKVAPLSTVQEQTTPPVVAAPKPASIDAPITPPSAGTEGNIGRPPLRSISGRRSMRPIAEIQFTHHRRPCELNDSVSSLNVTVGSDIYMDSLRTPGSANRKRKDQTAESTSEAMEGGVESPKRARLDFSGFLGMVATPVTMLKNRLSRVKLQSPATSTPRSLATEEEDASKVVPAEATSTTTNANVGDSAAEEAAKTTTTQIDVATEAHADKADVPEKDDATHQQSATASDSVADKEEDEVQVKIVTEQPQKYRCTVM